MPQKKNTTTKNKRSRGEAAEAPRAVVSQESMLAEAVETESANQRWLEVQRRAAHEAHATTVQKTDRTKRVKSRRLSRRGCYVTVTFPEIDLMSEVLKAAPRPILPGKKSCAVTGRPASYLDPKTKLPFADAAAFRQLRKNSISLPTNTKADCRDVVDTSELDLPIASPVITRQYF